MQVPPFTAGIRSKTLAQSWREARLSWLHLTLVWEASGTFWQGRKQEGLFQAAAEPVKAQCSPAGSQKSWCHLSHHTPTPKPEEEVNQENPKNSHLEPPVQRHVLGRNPGGDHCGGQQWQGRCFEGMLCIILHASSCFSDVCHPQPSMPTSGFISTLLGPTGISSSDLGCTWFLPCARYIEAASENQQRRGDTAQSTVPSPVPVLALTTG